MYKLELNDKEVRAIGERRWFRKYWKKLLILVGGAFGIILGIAILLSILDVSGREYITMPCFVVWVVIYLLSVVRMDKAGKRFLKNIQEVKNGLFQQR